MKLVNIYNNRRTIYLFCRDEEGRLHINKDNSFFPYFYEPYENGTAKSYSGIPLKKIILSEPRDVPKKRTNNAWEADIIFTRRFMIDRITEIEKCPVKWAMMDIEVLTEELPDVTKADKPVSCITIYNSFTKLYQTFYLGDYESEYKMMNDFISYLQEEKFDLITGWNFCNFDYPYLYNRFPDFAERISPINKTRWGGEVNYPAGTSIVDYLLWFKKITLNRETVYTLDAISQKYLKDNAKDKISFAQLSDELKAKNRQDVEQLVRLEEKFELISYFDEIRRLSKVEWEDMIWNSRMLDQLLLQEAKNNKIVLPMKPSEDRGTLTEKEDFQGAYREIFESGRFFNVGKYDLGSAYPQMIKEFCLDTANIKLQKEDNCLQINGTWFNQNQKTILPLVTNKLTTLKAQLKEKLATLDPSTQEYKDLNLKYKGTKSLVNSAYGVFGNRFFRLYDKRVASATTFLVRSVLKYIIEKLKEKGHSVIYADTDSVMIDNNTTDISDLLNELIQQWVKETFGKEKLDLEFAYEGAFNKLLLLALCRYVGYLKTEKGIKKEICGVEVKRKDSTKFLKKFQEELIDKILDGGQEKDISEWIKLQILKIKQVPLENIAFPCKLSRPTENYKNKPIFVRALENTKDFEKRIGDAFYYIYIIPESYEVKIQTVEMYNGEKLTSSKLKEPWKEYFNEEILVKNMPEDKKEELINHLEEQGKISIAKVEVKGKPIDVLAFDEENKAHIDKKRIDWDRIIERNVISKCEVIYEAMNWNFEGIK